MEIDRQALVEVFLAEAEENLSAIEHSLLALETSPRDAEALATVFRAVHTLKGNSASLGFTGLGGSRMRPRTCSTACGAGASRCRPRS